jgi:hypothetical protein
MAVTNCHYFPLMSSAPNGGCKWVYNIVLKISGKHKKSVSWIYVTMERISCDFGQHLIEIVYQKIQLYPCSRCNKLVRISFFKFSCLSSHTFTHLPLDWVYEVADSLCHHCQHWVPTPYIPNILSFPRTRSTKSRIYYSKQLLVTWACLEFRKLFCEIC